MTRSTLTALATSLVAVAALAFAGCGDASVGSPRGLDFGSGGGGTGHGSGANGATGGTSGQGSGGSPGAGGGVDAGTGGGGGGGGVDSGTPPQAASYGVSVDKSQLASDLLAQSTLTVTVTPNGFRGSAALSVVGLPTDVTAAFAPASVTLDGTTAAKSTLTLTTKSSTKPGAIPFSVVATSGAAQMSAPSTLTVASAITIQIPSGVDGLGGTLASPVRTAFGSYPIVIAAPQGISGANPVTVRFYNADSASHEIHASAPGAGFPHDPGSIAPQSMDRLVRSVNTTGTYDFYLHDQGGPATIGRIIIQ